MLDTRQLTAAAPGALRKLDPRHQSRNPVLFVVWVGSVLTTILAVMDPSVFSVATAAWLWATVLFAGFAESIAEGRGKAQADSLRKVTTETTARVQRGPHETQIVPSTELTVGDLVEVLAGETIPGDGDVVEGIATVDESAITGESAPVVRESGGDRSAVTGGTVVLSDRIVVRISSAPGESFVDRMIALVEGAERKKTPNEIALNILLAMLTIVFLVAVLALGPVAVYSGGGIDPIRLIALLVCLIPTTIGALLSAIGIAGMDRLVQHNVLATSGRAVEAAGDIDTLLLDKTGTITFGSRQATSLEPATGATVAELAAAARVASLADETPEGRSIVELCVREHGLPAEATPSEATAETVEFTARTRMSGIDLPIDDGAAPQNQPAGQAQQVQQGQQIRQIRKGAADAILAWVDANGGRAPEGVREAVERIARRGATPLVVAEMTATVSADRDPVPSGEPRVLGAVELSDVVKPGMRERFAELRAMGIRTVMITGDNPLTAAAIAEEAGVDDYLAEATPEDKLERIRAEQTGGRLVAMTGDGTNDAPALAQADVGVAMNTGTTAAKEAGNMVDLDSDPTKLIDIVGIGKQLLITRGALTTFSLANDLAKYFAILPALFVGIFPQLDKLNVMGLASPESAILSAVIFNAIVIVLLVPLALKGVKYRAASAASLLRRNLLIYGVGGVIAPFLGIWLIDLLVRHLPGIA
ncbi:potassium-transporting ATPase subunit KdpB [Dietzia sp. PP-33]|uniref:potassium-transporting ATPase subunit KdpB n=1 Tax=Dietzia sp. PP-33 TaxID=2957500 RepID=UPI0029ABD971|nr:potassium-transporting ATPase subunit KdpB [Dietzia sp. PP-33]MDX2358759.1 potassium-transporting ATPase subunit KdpB [Dietzia sp. PP-33]